MFIYTCGKFRSKLSVPIPWKFVELVGSARERFLNISQNSMAIRVWKLR